jgi:hypothetical protein
MAYPARAIRIPLERHAEVLSDGRRVHCWAVDMSLTGMALHCPGYFRMGQPIWVGFDLNDHHGHLALHAVVVRSEPTEGGTLWGVQFKGLDGTLVNCLRAFLGRKRSIFEELPAPAL